MRTLVATLVERRRAKRVNLNLRTRLMYGAQQYCDIVIRDLSFTGFKADGGTALSRGSLVSVNLPNIGLVRATIKWVGDGRIAGSFHRAVDVRTCFRTGGAAGGRESA